MDRAGKTITRMPMSPFEIALPFILRWEGGYVDHPADPGGATNRGVTQKVYDAWRTAHGEAAREVRSIDEAEVRAIYERGYWLPPNCHRLPSPLDLVQFDTAVNMGVGRAIRFLQAAVRCAVDGQFGPGTAQAVAGCDLGTAVIDYCDQRQSYYQLLAERNSTLQVFLKGWLNRLNALRQEAGLPGFEAAARLDYGDSGYVKRIPDIGEDPTYDVWP